ncbi:MAG: type II toxin-antitoxin system VapC family toxin [Methylococcaceae bacterium]
MKVALIDTDILSLYFRDNQNVVENFSRYLTQHDCINISIITYYEILSGLKHCDANKQIESFLQFVAQNNIVPLTTEAIDISAEKYAQLRKQGTAVDDIDLLIAGIAIANNLELITNNTRHFEKVSGLELSNWSIAN